MDLSAGSGRKHLSSGLGEAGFISATALFISVTSPSLLYGWVLSASYHGNLEVGPRLGGPVSPGPCHPLQPVTEPPGTLRDPNTAHQPEAELYLLCLIASPWRADTCLPTSDWELPEDRDYFSIIFVGWIPDFSITLEFAQGRDQAPSVRLGGFHSSISSPQTGWSPQL